MIDVPLFIWVKNNLHSMTDFTLRRTYKGS